MLTCAHVVRVASARCQVMPSDTASAAWSAQMSAGIPWSLRGPCRVLGAIVPVVFGYACVVRPFPTWVHGVPGFPHRSPKVVGIHPRYGVSRPALVRSECGCVLWWSVPVGPTWVRVQPPHVPKRGCAHTLLLRAAAASPASIERHAMVPPGGRVPSVPTRPTSRRYSLARIGSLGHANASA